MGHHYSWLIDQQNPGTDMTVLRTSDGVEEIFVPAVGWRPSQASERAHLLSGKTDERDARAILDRIDQNRFRPIDFPLIQSSTVSQLEYTLMSVLGSSRTTSRRDVM